VHDRVHAVVPLVDVRERLEDLAVVGELHPNGGVRDGVPVGHPVERHDAVSVLVQVPHDVPAELPAAAGDGDGRHSFLQTSEDAILGLRRPAVQQ
jgi:hypothetical protein